VSLTKRTKGLLHIKHCGRKNEEVLIILGQKFDVIERHERGHNNSKIERDVGMSKSTVRNIIKHAGEIKEKSIFASAFCG
jgi:hypothetical protein